MPAEKIPPMLLAMVGQEESIHMAKKKFHCAITLQLISRYLADALTYLGLVAMVADQMV